MISRRNIRVKVMQTLYNVTTLESDVKPGEPQRILQNHFDQTRQLFVHLTYFLTEVCRYAETDAHQRAGKHLPSFEDLHVNTKLSGNKILWKILDDPSFKDALAKMKFHQTINKDLVRRVYLHLAETSEYKSYISKQGRENKDEKEILEFILDKMLLADENFTSYMEENFTNWEDDGEMVIQLLVNLLQKPGSTDFKEMIGGEKKDFAVNLLKTVLDKSEYLQSLIIPKLKNWDPERIALLDMILMKMGVSEFLYFETIPPKVTINEYIDLAKEYSTPQSGQFVNGILDNIHKELVTQGKMQKVDYKKVQ
ncbi:MAG TPA: transcription antitermination factor NusB [Chitinophagaceae bacterium]|nr:transcription antitermination factor NusB [Chitinophagaceae bacterium]